MPIIYLILSLVLTCSFVEAAYVPINVDIGTALPVSGAVVSSGIPFAVGQIANVSVLRLTDTNGIPVPAQFTKLVSWPDGSVKVAMVSFVPVVAEGGATYKSYHLVYDDTSIVSPSINNPVLVTQSDSQVIVDTGVATFYLNKTTFSLFDQIKIGGVDQMASPGDLVFVDANTNNTFKTSLSQDYNLSIVEPGPIKTTILATGRSKAAIGPNQFGENTLVTVKVWQTFYANSGRVDIKYTWVDDIPRLGPPPDAAGGSWPAPPNAETVKYVNIKSNYLELPLTAVGSSYTIGGESSPYTGAVEGSKYLLQNATKTDWPYPVYTFSYSGVGSGQKAPGWMDVTRGDAGVTAAVRNFWQNYPNKLYVDDQGLLRIYVQPTESLDNTYSIAPGVGKTHDIYLDFHAGTDVVAASKRALLFLEIPVLYAGANWYAQSKAFGPISPPDSFSAKWDSEMEKLFACSSARSGCSGYPIVYGKRDYGDYIGGVSTLPDSTKIPVYYNQHYEDTHGWLLEYLRLGRKKYFNFAVPFAVHHYDLDVMHTTWSEIYPGYPAGMIHFHGSGEHEASKMEPGHIVPGGIDEYFLLTGDPRALEVSKEQGDWIVKYLGDGHGRIAIEKAGDAVLPIEYERAQAWAQYTVMKTFESTNDIKYWDAATIATKNTIDWWKMPNQAIVAYDYTVPIDMGRTPQSQSIYYAPLDWTQGKGYFMSTLQSANTATTSVPQNPSLYWPYQTHVPIAWMCAYLESTLIRYLENLKNMGGSYSSTVNYRGSVELISVDVATIKDMISQTVKIVADHNFESILYPSLFPWVANLNNNLWVYSASRERVLSSPTSTDGNYQIPYMLMYAASMDVSDVHPLLQDGWSDTQARLKALAQLTYNKYVTNYTMPGGNTGYNGAPVIWNMPYTLGLMSLGGIPLDTTAPVITAFTIPSTANSMTVPITTFTATDNTAVTGYIITESATPPAAGAAGWTGSAPTSYTAASAGSHTLYAWAKDAAGNVSGVYAGRVVVITLPAGGACGLAHGKAYAVAPASQLCSAGTASAVTGKWAWSCDSAQCAAYATGVINASWR